MTTRPGTTAFVLGGGGVRGAVEIGMLRALLERDITPDLVVGTSIGAINGAALAADPTPAVVPRLVSAWSSPVAAQIYGEAWYRQVGRLARTRTHLASPEPLRALLRQVLGRRETFADLEVPLVVAAASIERAAERWFSTGPLVDAVVASASVPGALPPTRIDGEHYVDGGVVSSIPLGEAVRRGADTIWVLQVGRIEEQLRPPRNAVEVAKVTFEISRRHRFARELAEVPDDVTVHVLPSGGPLAGDERISSSRRLDATRARAASSYAASTRYLDALDSTGGSR
ncbi:patatin-like phospholipase family protein [Cellulosimicrobium arenosum]|uniref:Patatin-like phospholipase family protein n=1 Tax=Cellulosimicrobium arenosum TaxID=2708133 RepID=A0A927G7D1_9MICO|nr:patatin-like phospholipase family protein [Cellulosimicrobium arenosum]MBD8078281.1 patatin-like phospholipase family protein [Cellulosimicrobium arenosum]